jgi:hypothetical protein
MRYTVSKLTGAVPVLFCRRQNRFLPMEEHLACDFAVAPVWDENGDPVSLICMYGEERREFQGYRDIPEGEGGVGD